MKTFKWLLVLVILSLLVSAVGLPTKVLAADNCPNGDGSDNNITCTTNDTDGIDAGAGNDTVTNTGTVSSPGTGINGNDGNDTIANDGTVSSSGGTAISGGNDTDKITNNGVVSGATVGINGDAGADTIKNSGSVTAQGTGIIGGDGDDVIANDATDSVSGSTGISGGNGNDNITNNGTVTGTSGTGISGDAGADTITNTATGTINGNLDGGSGSDTLNNAGTVTNNLSGGSSRDTITNSGTVNGNLDGGLGNDILTNTGSVAGDICGGSGNDQVTLAGTPASLQVGGQIDGGADTDTLNLTGLQPTYYYTDTEYQDLKNNNSAASGSFAWGEGLVTWLNFEMLNWFSIPTCPTGQHADGGGACVSDDPVCSGNQSLVNGECVDPAPVCPAGQHADGSGACVNDDPVCSGNQSLVNGECVDPAPVCPAGQHVDGGLCVNDVTAPVFTCPAGQHLEGSVCVNNPLDEIVRRNLENGFDEFIPVTGGQGVALSCADPFVTVLRTPLGTAVTFKQLCGVNAMVEDLPAVVLPSALPDGMRYLNGASTTLLNGDGLLAALPVGGGLIVDFKLPAGVDSSKLVILFWNPATGGWDELPVSIVDEHAEANASSGGQFILVSK
jgi:hypothetical protein